MSDDEVLIEKDDDEWFADEGWTSIPNRVLRDGGPDGLSWEARGMLTFLTSHSKNWRIRIEDLQKQGKCGRDRTRRILAELEEAGYLTRKQSEGKGGRFGVTRYKLRSRRSQPVTENPSPESPQVRPETDFPAPDEPAPDEPPTAGPPPDEPLPENTTPYKHTINSEHHPEEHETPAAPTDDNPAPSAAGPASGGEPDPFAEFDPPPLAAQAAAATRRGNRRRTSAAALNRTARSSTAQGLVEAWVATRHRRPPEEVFVGLTQQVDSLLRQEFAEREISAGLADWGRDGRHWSSLPMFVDRAANQQPGVTPRPNATDANIAALMAGGSNSGPEWTAPRAIGGGA